MSLETTDAVKTGTKRKIDDAQFSPPKRIKVLKD